MRAPDAVHRRMDPAGFHFDHRGACIDEHCSSALRLVERQYAHGITPTVNASRVTVLRSALAIDRARGETRPGSVTFQAHVVGGSRASTPAASAVAPTNTTRAKS
jgi:hypothetical protein